MTIKIALIGFGKIAREQHLPAISSNPRFTLSAVATPSGDPKLGVPYFSSTDTMFEAMAGELDAVVICTPPSVRYSIARNAVACGFHVLLEKPPTVTLGELQHLERLAHLHQQSLYVGWHSQHAPGVALARTLLADKAIASLDIEWHEDVRKWHPGQQWIWQPGGFGVFDPGINGLAIATRILNVPLLVEQATLHFPANKEAPIAASVKFAGSAMKAEMDWRPTSQEHWTIRVKTNEGLTVELFNGGDRLYIDGIEQQLTSGPSYPSIYNRFSELCATGAVEVDSEPLRIVADIFLRGKFNHIESFD